jgi:hypothetical protein
MGARQLPQHDFAKDFSVPKQIDFLGSGGFLAPDNR